MAVISAASQARNACPYPWLHWRSKKTPEIPGSFSIKALYSVADLMRLKDQVTVWQHYPLLEEVAFTRRRISPTVPLRVVRRGTPPTDRKEPLGIGLF
jgi:hypothetical protein